MGHVHLRRLEKYTACICYKLTVNNRDVFGCANVAESDILLLNSFSKGGNGIDEKDYIF